MITGITRVRNESLILEDTLKHYLGFLDTVVLYDDASTDNTVEIAQSFDRVTVIRGDAWRKDRLTEETRHRALLLDMCKTDWVYCFDADERLIGELPTVLNADGYRFALFDGYMTADCSSPYIEGELSRLDRMWGPERRDILMLFRKSKAEYKGLDKREPNVYGVVELASARIKHFGKCLSIDHWEETCDYYANHFPEPYKTKWRQRKGKAIHTKSDFGRELLTWDNLP